MSEKASNFADPFRPAVLPPSFRRRYPPNGRPKPADYLPRPRHVEVLPILLPIPTNPRNRPSASREPPYAGRITGVQSRIDPPPFCRPSHRRARVRLMILQLERRAGPPRIRVRRQRRGEFFPALRDGGAAILTKRYAASRCSCSPSRNLSGMPIRRRSWSRPRDRRERTVPTGTLRIAATSS